MWPFFFVNNLENLLDRYHTVENLMFLDTITLLFHQIFLYRLQNIRLDISSYNLPEVSNTDGWEESHQMTLFRCYQDIVNTVLSDNILRDHFSVFNSYEKISWDSFIELAVCQIPDFSSVDFYELLEWQKWSDMTALSMRLMADFWLSEAYISYMDLKYKNIAVQ